MKEIAVSINVTSPFLPPKAEYLKYVDGIWDRKWLTNHGPLVTELELGIKEYLGVADLKYVANGTIALQIGINALGLSGDVITTPFSYVATTSSLVWERCRPVMVDIDPNSLNIDPGKIEAAITENTTGILATHVYGHPCEVKTIGDIAARHGLKVFYDGAHAFGTRVYGHSVFDFGDLSMLSFHATKLFHTIEGGGLVATDPDLRYRIGQLRNFGHTSPTTFDLAGVNGKNSEFHAAMGLAILPHIGDIVAQRRAISDQYDASLSGRILRPALHSECDYNYAYYPVIFQSEAHMLRVMAALNAEQVFPRRYFFPSLSDLPYLDQAGATPIADDIAARVLCLPLYPGLMAADVDRICRTICAV